MRAHEVRAGAPVPAEPCPARSPGATCGPTCPVCGGRGVVPVYVAARYRFGRARR